MNGGRTRQPSTEQHVLSLLRPLLALVVWRRIAGGVPDAWVLPLVVIAAASDWLDGRLARRRGSESAAGKLLDNLCDVSFLAVTFAAMARVHVWSDPVWGSAVRYWRGANWLPVIGLAASFGAYSLRWALAARFRLPMAPSRHGRTAGVANWVLVLLGGLALAPHGSPGPWVLEPAFVTVALLNASAALDNLKLLALAVGSSRQR